MEKNDIRQKIEIPNRKYNSKIYNIKREYYLIENNQLKELKEEIINFVVADVITNSEKFINEKPSNLKDDNQFNANIFVRDISEIEKYKISILNLYCNKSNINDIDKWTFMLEGDQFFMYQQDLTFINNNNQQKIKEISKQNEFTCFNPNSLKKYISLDGKRLIFNEDTIDELKKLFEKILFWNCYV